SRRRPSLPVELWLNPFLGLILLLLLLLLAWTLGVVALIWTCERLSDVWDWVRGGPRRRAWAQAMERLPFGRRVLGTVTAHHHFGIVVDVGDPLATGLVTIKDFCD